MTTAHVSGLLTISAIAGDRVCTEMFTCAVLSLGFNGAADLEQPTPQTVVARTEPNQTGFH